MLNWIIQVFKKPDKDMIPTYKNGSIFIIKIVKKTCVIHTVAILLVLTMLRKVVEIVIHCW